MLFMGEEWGARTPWQFFTSHPEPALATAAASSGSGWLVKNCHGVRAPHSSPMNSIGVNGPVSSSVAPTRSSPGDRPAVVALAEARPGAGVEERRLQDGRQAFQRAEVGVVALPLPGQQRV